MKVISAKMKASKNLSGLSCFAGDGFCGMARSSGNKKSHQSDLDSNSEDEVRDELPFLHEENECLGQLLDNRDDMLREAKKMRKELRASLEDARNYVAELETQNLDAKCVWFLMRLIAVIALCISLILLLSRISMLLLVKN
jgi:flagellar motility protein MotE (MotC chaperone)